MQLPRLHRRGQIGYWNFLSQHSTAVQCGRNFLTRFACYSVNTRCIGPHAYDQIVFVSIRLCPCSIAVSSNRRLQKLPGFLEEDMQHIGPSLCGLLTHVAMILLRIP